MSGPFEDKPLRPSVWDRLTDSALSARRGQQGAGQSMDRLKQCVRRDLENLFNTRWRCSAWPPGLEELESSLVNYGIPDFTGTNMSSAGNREHFRRIIESAIRTFEPRFASVHVEMLDPEDKSDRTLRFRIDAELKAVPHPEPVVFDSRLEPLSRRFEVIGHDR